MKESFIVIETIVYGLLERNYGIEIICFSGDSYLK